MRKEVCGEGMMNSMKVGPKYVVKPTQPESLHSGKIES